MTAEKATLIAAILSSITGVIGFVLGAYLTDWFGARSQHKQFVRDSKTKEYRTLLDTLGNCVREIKNLKNYSSAAGLTGDPTAWLAAMRQHAAETYNINQQIASLLLAGSQVVEDRFFIHEALQNNHVREDWGQIEAIANRPRSGQAKHGEVVFSTTELTETWGALAAKIRRIAEEDLSRRAEPSRLKKALLSLLQPPE